MSSGLCDNLCDKPLSPTPKMPPTGHQGVGDNNPASATKSTTYQKVWPT